MDKTGATSRALVTPADHDLYRVQITHSEKGASTEYDFEAWASKVGDSTFLTLRSLRATAKVPLGAFVFAPANAEAKPNSTTSAPSRRPSNATSMELRAEIRARLKDGTLYGAEESSDWQRTAEVYLQKDGVTGAFTPLRYENRWETQDLSGTFRPQQPSQTEDSKSVGQPR